MVTLVLMRISFAHFEDFPKTLGVRLLPFELPFYLLLGKIAT